MGLLKNMNKYINVNIFLISLAIGLFLNYVTLPTPNVVFVYPTDTTYKNIQYKDNAGNCFGFVQKEVLCPRNESSISKVPFQKGGL